MRKKLEGMNYVEVENKGEEGFLYYDSWKENDVDHFMVLPYGYYATNEKMAVKLFQKFADEVISDKPCEFSVNLYAMDDECMKAFHMMPLF